MINIAMNKETRDSILDIKEKVNQRLEKFFKQKIKEAAKKDKIFKESIKLIADFTLRGGKRMRAALLYYGYLACGKRKSEKVLEVALCMELAHSFLLIHDDIIDNDNLRRGKPTMHREYSKLYWNLNLKRPEKFGESLALLAGDIAYSLAISILCKAKFDEKLKVEAIHYFETMIRETAIGEMMDILISHDKRLDKHDIIKMYKYKTAKYSLEGPLILGAILGGGNKNIKAILSEYAICLGVAFQINDDILGIFGNEKEIGKEVGSDLREGKLNLLTLETLKRASSKDKIKLRRIFKKNKVLKKDVEFFKKIAEKTEALKYCLEIANNLSVKAKQIIIDSKIAKVSRDFLLENAEFLLDRKR
jgi:geranylgeranyl diphosphate synthase type I